MSRLKYFLILVGIILILGQVTAQNLEDMSLDSINFDQAKISFAGPSAFLLRDARLNDHHVSFIVRLDAQGEWRVTEVITQDDIGLPYDAILDFVRIHADSDGMITIDGILLEGEVYKTQIQILPDNTLGIPQYFDTGTFIGRSLTRAMEGANVIPRSVHEEIVQNYEISREETMNEIAQLGNRIRQLESDEEELVEQVTVLVDQVLELEDERTDILDILSETQAELHRLREKNDALLLELEQTRTTLAEMAESRDAVEIPESDFVSRVTVLESQVRDLNDRIRTLENREYSTPVVEADIDGLTTTIQELRRANALFVQERNDIENDLRETFAWDGYLAVVRQDFSTVVLQGMNDAEPSIGRWIMGEGKSVQQTDRNQFFARLDIPLQQNNQPYLYTFTGQSTGPGWAGFGIHLFAENSVKNRGYGFGDSLLVWLTRDPQIYGSDQTYLELYRSRDDVNMERVLHAAIEENVSSPLKIEILYEPQQDYITITVNDEEKIRYKTWFSVESGVQVALRSLGTARFDDFTVRTR